MSKFIIANWKSHKTPPEAQTWWDEFKKYLPVNLGVTQVVIAPPLSILSTVQSLVAETPIKLAVQDISPFPTGSYTGAIAAPMLNEFGVKYAIVGHSERRRYFHETHTDVANKVDQALQVGITPIICIDAEYLSAQVNALSPDTLCKCIVAYEPLEAIGSGENLPADQVVPVLNKIKESCPESPIIYGGSVDAGNVAEYLAVCDGVLVGSASLKPDTFGELVRAATL